MKRLPPAQVWVIAAAVGLAAANAARLHNLVAVLVAAGLTAVAAAALPLPARVSLAAVGVCLLGWGWGTVRLDALDRSPLTGDIDRSGRALLEITGEARHGAFKLRIPGSIHRFEGRPVGERVQLELPLGRAPPQGALIDALVVVRLPRGPSHGFDERLWLRRQGVHEVLQVDDWQIVGHRGGLGGIADRLRRWLKRDAAPGLTGQRRAVVNGVVLGDDTDLSYTLKNGFRRSGLYHLLAVSGQNVVLLAAGVLGVAWLVGLPRAVGHFGALAAIGAYVLAVGPQPSVIRAAVSGCAVSIAWLAARERDQWHVLALAAVVLLGWSPYMLFDAGFQLSFAAVVAIFLFARPLMRMLEGYPVHPKLGAALAISLACSLMTAPILLVQFGQVPVLGVVANALVEPVVGPLLGLALVTAVVHPVSPALAYGLAWIDGWLAAYVAWCASTIGAIPFAQVTGRAAVAVVAGTFVLAAYAWHRWRTT